mmetsp:Transcript_49807/g.75779  ORF Transcript_49807/g.75779 Transcript_49807/m.75779 type:complete len:208 (-) Transcript_49807:212-835(-)|eukprot:CAMPEP_0117035442 /NCGR_PEP_ID=MMETSP0472-20121206/25168_1 /TAXON_ID=693140 ORGANISM="Tiarina fusus, Strain LIS" /NCGR_SAMPLE_ID=MMETSP0472 /ASSEMBLY_ACC=CAM_ASM_000603 /LENGTH=207 /DNA_ID=CAMNT_0004744907 /DNA_START=90 /DNA_END=713 /DNA_ORIENTATION=+
MLLDFPYSVDDEPTDDWTIEQVMHWWLLQAHSNSDAAYEDMVSRLSGQLAEAKASLWEDHRQVTKIMAGEGSDENSNPQNLPDTNTTEPAKATASSQSSDTIHIQIVDGEYQGTSYDLQPKGRVYSWVGRSQGKKFREKGISLPKDLEVSTTHGRFETQRGKFYFVDTGSTNGSKVGNMDLEPNAPIELETGMEITIGQTVMRITLP